MNAEDVLDRLMEAGVSVWLDDAGKLRIDKGASDELKDLVRQHKQGLVDIRRAQGMLNSPGFKIIRLPLGHLALAHPLGADLDQIGWAMEILHLEPMPLVINDEDFEWISYEEWRRRQPLCTRADLERYHRQREAEASEKAKRRRRSA